MKGCLSLIIKTIIAVLVFFGLKYLGVVDFLEDKISDYRKISKEQTVQKAKDIVDLSQIDDEYTVDKTIKILKNRMILAQHNATGQKMIIIEPKNGIMLSKEDITSGNIQEKIDNLLSKYKNQILKFDKVEVVKQGSFKGIDQTIPFVKINAEIANLPVKDMEGIVGVAQVDDETNLIIISANEKNKYSQIITEAFFNKVHNVQ